jgi:hypothetical protein
VSSPHDVGDHLFHSLTHDSIHLDKFVVFLQSNPFRLSISGDLVNYDEWAPGAEEGDVDEATATDEAGPERKKKKKKKKKEAETDQSGYQVRNVYFFSPFLKTKKLIILSRLDYEFQGSRFS